MSSIGRIINLNLDNRYEPVGSCIYCKNLGGKLTREHIIPLSLAGKHILPSASCDNCQKVIKLFEKPVIQKVFGAYVFKYGLPTQNPKKRPKKLRARGFVGYGRIGVRRLAVDVSPAEHPGIMVLPILPPPRPPYVSYNHDDESPFQVEPLWVYPHPLVLDRVKPFYFTSYEIDSPDRLQFCRFMAKIAHGIAVASFGLDAFEYILEPLILGNTSDHAAFVGILGTQLEAMGHSVGFSLDNSFGETYLLTHIRLFAGLHNSPTYCVVTGKVVP